jgi:hypothetical protein
MPKDYPLQKALVVDSHLKYRGLAWVLRYLNLANVEMNRGLPELVSELNEAPTNALLAQEFKDRVVKGKSVEELRNVLCGVSSSSSSAPVELQGRCLLSCPLQPAAAMDTKE